MAGIYKRGNTWWARAQRDGIERRTSLKTPDRRVAEKRFRDWLKEIEDIAWGGRPRVAFAEAVRMFMQEHLPTLKPRSAQRYITSLKWLADHYEGAHVEAIDRKSLAAFESWRRGMGASAPTIRRDLACLSSLMTACEDRDWIEDGKNPVPGYLRRRARRGLKESPPRTRHLSHDEERRLVDECSGDLRNAVILAIETGLREQELFSLTWAQVDLSRGVIRTTADTKNRRIRVVPIGKRSAQILAQLKTASNWPVQSLFVLHHENGQRYRSLRKSFLNACKRAGVDGLWWHDLRRTAGCRWLQDDGLRMEEVSMLLGHSSIEVTAKRYAFLDGQTVAQAAAMIKSENYNG